MPRVSFVHQLSLRSHAEYRTVESRCLTAAFATWSRKAASSPEQGQSAKHFRLQSRLRAEGRPAMQQSVSLAKRACQAVMSIQHTGYLGRHATLPAGLTAWPEDRVTG